MKIGTKSVLFGAHCFFIHPIFVFIAWWKLYGFPFDPRLWFAFFLHDVGYWGKPNMDGVEGEKHPEFAAKIMHRLFDAKKIRIALPGRKYTKIKNIYYFYWHDLCLYHSRFYAKKDNAQPSRLCTADKLSICLEPAWLYLPRVNWSCEITEYMKLAAKRKYKGEPLSKYESMGLETKNQKAWFNSMTSYLRRWVEEHKDGKPDQWTPGIKKSINDVGVWQ